MSRVMAADRFYQVGGAIASNAPSYVQRQADRELLTHAVAGDFCYVLTPRQMGKSSLVARTAAQLRQKRMRSVVLNLQGKTERDMPAETFYAGLLDACIRQLKLSIDLTRWWQEHGLLSAVQRFMNFITDEILARVSKRLVIFVDEIDIMLNWEFSDDFFATIRAFYNDRTHHPAYKRLTVVLVGSASPSDLVKDRTLSPFNIGHRIELTDFTFDEAHKLTEGLSLDDALASQVLARVLHWTGGQPYLTQKVCAELAANAPMSDGDQRVDRLVDMLFFSDAPWSDLNLQGVRDRIVSEKNYPDAVLELYRRIISGVDVPDDERSPVHAALKLSGVVKVFPGGVLHPRNRIYERVFSRDWVDTTLRSQKRQPTSPIITPDPVHATISPPQGGEQLSARWELAAWKGKLAEALPGWHGRLEQTDVDSIYAFLAALTLQPVMQAARAGEWAALMTLGSVVASAGSSWLASHIQNWQNETEAAHHIALHVATAPELKAELDAIFDALEVFPQAQQALPEADRQWFVHTLRAELAHQGHLSRFAVQLTGSGAVAQGVGAVAAGQGGVAIGGHVYGNVYTGPSTRDPDEALRIYLQVLIENCRHVSLRGLDIGASDVTSGQQRFDLSQVYVELLTTTQVPQDEPTTPRRRQRESLPERETRPLSALEAIARNQRLVLLGDPGSGKSTCLTYLAFCLAAHPLEPNQGWLERLQNWPQAAADIVPVPIVLRDFAQWLPADTKKAEASHLWRFMVERLEGQNLAFVTEALDKRLENGTAMLLLDGLDEIPTARQRVFLRDAVTAFARRYPRCRMVVTCRTLSYQEPDWQLDDFETFTLAPFTAEQIDRFISSWHAELARSGSIKSGSVDGATRHLQATVRRPDLWRLASNPLLLTVITLVHTHKGRLPEVRAVLYKEAVEILLWRWDEVRVSGEDETPRLRQLLMQANRTEGELQSKLGRLAFEVHQQGGTAEAEGVADIGEGQLSRALVELHPDRSRDWAHQVIEVIKLRAGLLLERAPEVYTFPHRTFQEYLAGVHLATEPDFAQQAAQLAAQGAFWREVILLAVGHLTHVNRMTAGPLALIAELCPVQPAETDVAWRQVWLAGDVLLEMGRNRMRDSALGRELDERVVQRLVALLRSGHLTPVERVAAGNTLAHLGDPRFREDAWYLPDDPLLGFVEIPAGRFKMGSNKRDSLAFPNETPQRTITLPHYYIARYPVTVAQFRAFVEARDYTPQDKDSLQGLPNHPVVWVSWYDALEYCKWLTACLQTWEDMPEPLKTLLCREQWKIILPSEAEWEKAARGTDGRRYPWENDAPDPNRANYAETGIGTTSAVGCFPSGRSPYGLEDMSGNVWEWTRSLWEEYPYPTNETERSQREDLQAPKEKSRVLRGGAFWYGPQGVRCAYRFRLVPRSVLSYVGFRVVLAVRP